MNKIQKIQKVKIGNNEGSNKLRSIDSQFVQNRMALTAREWRGKKVSPYKSIEKFDAMIGWNERSSGKNARGLFNKKFSVPI